VYLHNVRADQVCPLGTPEDVRHFESEAARPPEAAAVR
jgi:hypothetical protein